jgi:RNA polymerase sigma factor (sigma-70 family)
MRRKAKFVSSLVASHGRQLTKFFVSRLPDSSEALDLVQEVYLRLLRLQAPDLIRCPEAYLFTIAANLVREHGLKRSTRPVHIAIDDTPAEDLTADVELFAAAAPEDAVLQAERVRKLEHMLRQLSPKARATLIWHRRDGQTYEEIAERLGISRNMVKKYLAQALAHCRKSVEAEQGD